jgi:4-amino-4-deoxy-L-arabinose transferase-like glycosyltransferase
VTTHPDRHLSAARFPGWILLAAVAAVVALSGSHPPLSTSARYVLACKEMVDRGDWVVPHLGHVPYLEKPILVYWLGAAARVVFGDSDRAAQLPAALATLVTLLATCAIGTRLRSPAFGLTSALFVLTAAPSLAMATTFTPDSILIACLTVAWWSFTRFQEQPALRWRLAFWSALGLGVLAKGPIAIVMPALALVGYGLLAGGPRGLLRLARELGLLSGAALILALNLPWSLLAWQRDPRYLEFFYVRANLQAFFDGSVHHPQAAWYYGAVLLGLLFPISPLALPAAAAAMAGDLHRREDPSRRTRLFLSCAVLCPFAFLCLSASKLGTYPMPLVPILTLLALDRVVDWEAQQKRWCARLLAIFSGLLIFGVVVAIGGLEFGEGLFPARFEETRARLLSSVSLLVGAGALALAAAGALACALRGRLLRALAFLTAGSSAFVLLALPNADRILPQTDPTSLVERLTASRRAGEPIYLHQSGVEEYRLHLGVAERMHIVGRCHELGFGHFVEVRDRSVPLPPNPDAVDASLLPDHPWLCTADQLATAWSAPGRLWLLGETKIADELRARGLVVHELARAGELRLMSNRTNP